MKGKGMCKFWGCIRVMGRGRSEGRDRSRVMKRCRG